jgi:uncharacterized membrane protein YeaQ/YmgE (transglycosylase-associated protein family)
MGWIYVGSALVIAVAIASIGQFVSGYSRGGCPVSFVVAFFGAMVGPAAATELGFGEPFYLKLGEVQFPLVTSAASALILVLIVNLATRRRKF